jgi:hypothetical protein
MRATATLSQFYSEWKFRAASYCGQKSRRRAQKCQKWDRSLHIDFVDHLSLAVAGGFSGFLPR